MPEGKVIQIEIDGFGEDDFTVQSFRGSESISGLFRYSLVLASKQPVHNFDDLLEAKAHLRFGDPVLHVHGMLCSIQQGYDDSWAAGSGSLTLVEVVLVPTVWKLSLHSRTRIYRDMTAPEVVEQVIGEADPSMKVTMNASGSHPKREFWLQYEESDLDFIQRLCEHEGIHYHFLHGESEEEMVFGDANAAFQAIPEDAEVRLGNATALPGQSHLGPFGADQTILKFYSRQRFIPKKVVLQDYNYEASANDLKVEVEADAKAAEGVQYAYGENYKDTNEGNTLKNFRKEELLTRRRVYTGQGTVRRFYPGGSFKLTNVDRIDSELGQEYLITDFTVDASQPVEHTRAAGHRYLNDFTCIPTSVVFRPERRTPCPKIAGLLHAKVVAADGAKYAEIDDQGRYRVHFAFDIDDIGTIPIRLIEPYAGGKYGTHWPLHKDVEVLVGFENGDPDRPIIVAAAYNDAHTSPVTGENQSQSINRTAGQNEIVYEDKEGAEYLWLRSPADETFLSLGKGHESAGHASTAKVSPGATLCTQESISINAGKSVKISSGNGEHKGGVDDASAWFNKNQGTITAAVATAATASAITMDFMASKWGALWSVIPDVMGWAGGMYGKATEKNVYISSPTKVAVMSGAETFIGSGLALDCVSTGSATFMGALGALFAGIKSASVVSGGRVEAVSLKGDVVLHAKKEDVKIEAKKNVHVEAEENDIKLEAKKENIEVHAKEKDIQMKCKKDFSIMTEEGHLQVTIKDAIDMTSQEAKQITVRAGDGSLVLKDGEVVLKCGDASITLKKNGDVTIKGKNIETDASGRTTVKSSQMVKIKGSLVDVQEGAMKAS